MWILTHHVNCWSYILHLSNTWEKMGIKWSSASAIYRLQDSLGFTMVAPWNGEANRNVSEWKLQQSQGWQEFVWYVSCWECLKEGDVLVPLLFKFALPYPAPVLVLSQSNPVHASSSQFLKIHFNIIPQLLADWVTKISVQTQPLFSKPSKNWNWLQFSLIQMQKFHIRE